MTNTERQQLKPGDQVLVQMDDGRLKQFAVKYPPWQLGHGDWVIGLQGYSGGYLLSRVQGRAEAAKD